MDRAGQTVADAAVIRPMFLDIGNIERIDEPTADQIVDRLRNLPVDAPFAVLNADEVLFI